MVAVTGTFDEALDVSSTTIVRACHLVPGMKRTSSRGKHSNTRHIATRSRKPIATGRRFVVCVRNDGCEASLERNKIYAVLPDDDAERDGDLRVVDESGEDYLFSADRFVAIDVPAAVKASLLRAS